MEQDSKDKKIRALIAYYENLKSIYGQLLEKLTIRKIIEDIREIFGWPSTKITDAKILDFILWVQSQK